ncbi:DNA adenine methylase [Paenibacillus athensensis]|uniref:DNA adenine methylase n=1 Tax=Paenibacillus athensensis TaxID=1967502 RepID=A0A4Y8PZM6_9BACL|nr:DNA adenine methylase [Paenibacillus athensensis]MCD1261277.1 DNA adenine methylase [Paenibacillus athensensis]
MLKSPIRWQGGKSRLRTEIIRRFPIHKCYVEVFGGGGWVLFGKERSTVEVFADINSELVNFYRVIQESWEELAQRFEWALYSRDEFQRIMARRDDERDPVTRAYDFYYRVYSHFGGKYSDSDDWGYTRTKPAFDMSKVKEKFKQTHQRLIGVYLENRSFEEIIQRYDSPDTFFYVDPPYLGLSGYLYKFTEEHHQTLRDLLHGMKGTFLLSINDHPQIREWYAPFQMEGMETRYTIAKQTSSRQPAKELLIANYDMASLLKEDKQ